MSATVDDIIVDTTSGEIKYIVVNTSFDDGEHWIPIPLSLFQLDGSTQALVLNADLAMLQSAPFFQDGQFPDTTLPNWSSEFDAFWQNGGTGTGSGSGAAGNGYSLIGTDSEKQQNYQESAQSYALRRFFYDTQPILIVRSLILRFGVKIL